MPKELKKKTLIFLAIIYLLSIISTLITKDTIIAIDIIISASLLSFFYIRYYPVENNKKALKLDKLALIMGVLYLIVIVVSFLLKILFL